MDHKNTKKTKANYIVFVTNKYLKQGLAMMIIMTISLIWPYTNSFLLFNWNFDGNLGTFFFVFLCAVLLWNLVAFWYGISVAMLLRYVVAFWNGLFVTFFFASFGREF